MVELVEVIRAHHLKDCSDIAFSIHRRGVTVKGTAPTKQRAAEIIRELRRLLGDRVRIRISYQSQPAKQKES